MGMDSRTRVVRALETERPDRVPVFSSFSELSVDRVATRLGLDENTPGSDDREYGGLAGTTRALLNRYCDVVRELDLDAASWGFATGLDDAGEGPAVDKYGISYHVGDVGVPVPRDGPIDSIEDVDDFDMAARLDPADFDAPRYIAESLHGEDRAHVVGVDEPFATSWKLRGGMDELLMDFHRDPELVHELARTVTDWTRAVIDEIDRLGADAVLLFGDVTDERAMLMAPEQYREFVRPSERAVVDHGHDRGLYVIQNDDGNAWPVLDDFVEIGFDGFHPVQPQCMDIGEVTRHLSGKMCVLGNIDCRHLLTAGSPGAVERTVRETIDAAAPGGGYVLCSSNSIHPGGELDNYLAMIRAAKRYGEDD